MYHVTRALIDTGAIAHNYRVIREYIDKTSSQTEIICVLKADGYGHGARTCAKIYRSLGVRNFAVSNLDEAIEVRSAVGEDSMVLVLGYTDPVYAQILTDYQITQTVYSLDYAKALSEHLHEDLSVHIKVDTGMNRLGFRADREGTAEAVRALSLPHLCPDGVYTHFATADQAQDPMTKLQFERFVSFVRNLSEKGIAFRMHHVCNSAAALRYPEMHLDAVRCGIILYGLKPSPAVVDIGLRAVMSLHTKISHIHEIVPGDSVSYGATYTPDAPKKIATLPIGYDDGFLRAYAEACGVYIHGKFAKILGRICMDQCMVDVTDISCAVGDDVCIFGGPQSADVFAKAAGTINYEVTCMVGKRVPRDEVKSD